MNSQDTAKIERFSQRIPPHLIDHWNEIIDIINDDYTSQLEMNNFQLIVKLRNTIKYLLIMALWIKEKKINSLTGFLNMIHFIKSKAKND